MQRDSRARRLYRLLLLLFPPSFRRGFGPDLEQLFADRLREEIGLRRAGLCVLAAWDVGSHAAREWAGVAGAVLMALSREGRSMDGWIQDLRFGLRSLRGRPGFTLAAATTLALGIGATVSIFSVVNGVLLRPLEYPESENLMVVWRVDARDGSRSNGIDHPDVRHWQQEVPGLRVAGYGGSRPTLTGFGDPEVIYSAVVTDGLLEVFGLAPELGRDLSAADDVPGGPAVVVISHQFWTERLGQDPGVVGRTIELNGGPWEVVGVAPAGFDFPNGAELWRPRRHDESGCGHGCRIMSGIARVEAGTTLEAVQDRLDGAMASLAEAYPDSHRDDLVRLEPLLDAQVSDVRSALLVLMAAVGMVLLIACANVANLLLVRGGERVGEVAVRATLGADRLRLVRQMLTESLLLALLGGSLGLLMATWGVSIMKSLAHEGIPRLDGVTLDGPVVAFSLAVVMGVTLVFGLLPALQLARRPLQAMVSGGRRTEGGPGTRLSRSLLLSVEVALSLTLLLGAGLLFRTLQQIRAVDLGYHTERVERFRVSTPESRYDVEGTIRFQEELETRLAALPGVEAVGSGFGSPLASGNVNTSVNLLDRPELPPPDRPSIALRPASAGYLDAVGLTLLQGRWIESSDRSDSERVVVINAAAAERFYPGEDPIGKRLRLDVSWGFDDEPARTVVGVTGDVRGRSAREADEPAAYVPNAQFGADVVHVSILLSPGTASVIGQVRSTIAELDPALAITSIERMEDAVEEEQAAARFYFVLLGVFSALAVVLASVGLYGVVAYAVSRRTREIGIRVALGARREDVVGLVLREGLAPAIAGVGLGLGGALLGARALSAVLYGVTPQDPATVVSVSVVLLVVVLAATLTPARRASRVPPASALRTD